ncbi:hypothetical protein [Mycobacterium asiaticum]|nr:hypothetical protein [Mycobacterium asiaticum]
MRAEGFSFREIGLELGIDKMKVHRILKSAPPVPEDRISDPTVAAAPADGDDLGGDAEPGDPLILSWLSAADLELLGVSAGDLAGQRGDPLHCYRMLGLIHTERGRRERARLTGRQWVLWLLRESGAADRVGSDGPTPQHVRDARIVELKRSGWTLEAIAREVGLSGKGAVSNALARIARELNGSEVD